MNAAQNNDMCRDALDFLSRGASALKYLPGVIERIIDAKAWEEREVAPGRIVRMNSLLELITTDPINGWGEDPAKIEAILKRDNEDSDVLVKWRAAMLKPEGGDKRSKDATTGNNITSERITGTSATYTAARLAKDFPELYQRVKNNELTRNAAAIMAGFRKKTFQVVADDPHAAARSLLKHFDPDVLVAAIRDVANG